MGIHPKVWSLENESGHVIAIAEFCSAVDSHLTYEEFQAHMIYRYISWRMDTVYEKYKMRDLSCAVPAPCTGHP